MPNFTSFLAGKFKTLNASSYVPLEVWLINIYHRRIKEYTLYSTMQTKILSGMRKKFMMVLLASSGMYCDLIFMMDGQKIPTHASKVQNPKSCIDPANEILRPFIFEGVTRNCPIKLTDKRKS